MVQGNTTDLVFTKENSKYCPENNFVDSFFWWFVFFLRMFFVFEVFAFLFFIMAPSACWGELSLPERERHNKKQKSKNLKNKKHSECKNYKIHFFYYFLFLNFIFRTPIPGTQYDLDSFIIIVNPKVLAEACHHFHSPSKSAVRGLPELSLSIPKCWQRLAITFIVHPQVLAEACHHFHSPSQSADRGLPSLL